MSDFSVLGSWLHYRSVAKPRVRLTCYMVVCKNKIPGFDPVSDIVRRIHLLSLPLATPPMTSPRTHAPNPRTAPARERPIITASGLISDLKLENHRLSRGEVLMDAGHCPEPLDDARHSGSVHVEGAPDGRSQKAKQKRLISTISLFSLVFKRRATGEKAPSSAHRESAKSALFL